MNDVNLQNTIMVVDDTPENLRVLQEMLQAKGYRVVTFPNGNMALKAAEKNPPDLILLDIIMPGMNGYEVCEKLKSDNALKEIPVLFISAITDSTEKIHAFAVGGVDYVTKPFECDEVLARVETHLALQNFRNSILLKNKELDESYKKLKELQSLRETLTQMVVHDLRSPLSGIMGYIGILLEQSDAEFSEENKAFLRQAMASTLDLTSRISAVLDVNRLEEGAMPLKKTETDVKSLVEKSIGELAIHTQEISVNLDLPEASLMMVCDSDLIGRVIANLLQNAMKFAPMRSTIDISAKLIDSNVRISIHDNGPGVPMDFREGIFEKYKQVEAWKDGKRRGTGLGLAFCKLAVESHGGEIGVECPPGGGSIFWFSLPQC